jgi:DNA-binding PadR family transcriptional regulator
MSDLVARNSTATGGWVVLGLLLQDSPQSGYDLASRATRTISHFWPITKAQVYAELPRLEAVGYLDGEDIAQQGAPDKRVYRPTPGGRAAFKTWIDSADLGQPKLRHPLLLRLWFATASGRARLLSACAEYRAALTAERARFDDLLKRIDARREQKAGRSAAVAYRRLALKHGLLRVDAELRWLDDVGEIVGAEDL